MMTQNSSCSRIFAVWMVLLAFLCGMIVPSLAIANQDMEIELEGDPGDGLENDGGGSSQEFQNSQDSKFVFPSSISYLDNSPVSGFFDLGFYPNILATIPIYYGNAWYFIIIQKNSRQFVGGRN